MDEKETMKPYISADRTLHEMTPLSIIVGIILAIVFGAANAYLGLRVGMTVSASIPAAVLGMGVYRLCRKKDTILESNMVQTIGSAGESLAAGAIFTRNTALSGRNCLRRSIAGRRKGRCECIGRIPGHGNCSIAQIYCRRSEGCIFCCYGNGTENSRRDQCTGLSGTCQCRLYLRL